MTIEFPRPKTKITSISIYKRQYEFLESLYSSKGDSIRLALYFQDIGRVKKEEMPELEKYKLYYYNPSCKKVLLSVVAPVY